MDNCEICLKGCTNLSMHIKAHCTVQEYYERFLMKDAGEKVCFHLTEERGCFGSGKNNFISLRKGFNKFCSSKCANSLESKKEKGRKTCFENYGVENPGKSEIVKKRIKETSLKKYGVEFPNSSEIVKEKKKQTNLSRRGVEFHTQDPKVKEKTKQTCLEKYGGVAPLCSKKVQKKAQETCLKNHGVPFPQQNKKVREKSLAKNIEKIGVGYPMQNEGIFYRTQKKKFKRKNYLLPSGRVVQLQGFEPQALDRIFENGGKEQDIEFKPKAIDWEDRKGNKRKYYPDFKIKKKLIEVKSEYTFSSEIEENLLKHEASIKAGFIHEFHIFGKSGRFSSVLQ